MRAVCAMTLGWWHAYKVANERLYARFIRTIWGPALHALTPRAIIRPKPKLTQILTLFTQCRLAYPAFSDRLASAIRNTTLSDDNSNHLINLRDVFEFFIPSVRSIRK
jgi:hypothetical protein